MKCAWCEQEAVARIEVQPAQYRTSSKKDPQSGERISVKELTLGAIQVDVCEAHKAIKERQPDGPVDTRRRKAKGVEQVALFDVDAARGPRHAIDDAA